MEAAAASPLSELLAPQVGALFQDAVDQLAVLGALAPPEEGEGRGGAEAGGVLGDEVGSIVQEQRELERKYDAVRLDRGQGGGGGAAAIGVWAGEEGGESVLFSEAAAATARGSSASL